MKNHLPNSNTDADTLEEWELQVMDLEQRLRPVAQSQSRGKGAKTAKAACNRAAFYRIIARWITSVI